MMGAGAITMGLGSQAGLLKLYSNLVMDLPCDKSSMSFTKCSWSILEGKSKLIIPFSSAD